MFRHRGAIFREVFRTKEYNPTHEIRYCIVLTVMITILKL